MVICYTSPSHCFYTHNNYPPSRTLPRAVLIGVAIVITAYLLTNFAFFSVLSYDQILNNEAVALVSTCRPT